MKTAAGTEFDNEVLQNIKEYIARNNLSMKKIAEETGLTYIQLWTLLNRNQSMKLNDYIALCRTFQEPIDTFIPEQK